AALRILAPGVAQRSDPGDVRIRRIEDDAADVLGGVEPEVGPGAPGVDGTINTVAHADRVVQIPFAGAGPDDHGIRLEDGERTDRGDRLLVEERLPGGTAVDRLPDAARGAANVD